MRAYIAFSKKEFIEFTRTYKLLIILIVFILLGMMNPITAKLTPVLLENFMPEGITITIADPTALDSWMQFYKNVGQIGLIVVALLFSGIVSNEYSKCTLVNLLAKGLKRKTVIFSKFTVASILFSISYWICFGISWIYTEYFWSRQGLNHILFAACCLWIYGLVIISAIIMGSTLFSNSYGSLLFTGGFVGLQFITNIIPEAYKYNPLSLAIKNMDLIKGNIAADELLLPMIFSITLYILFLIISILVFNKKKI